MKILIKKQILKKFLILISNFSEKSEIRYVGGSIRKIINNEKVDDIDLATNINPKKVCEILKKIILVFMKVVLSMELLLQKLMIINLKLQL